MLRLLYARSILSEGFQIGEILLPAFNGMGVQ